jgi:hypothetical protein
MKNNSIALPETDPSGLIGLRDSVYATDLLITALGHLDFFTVIEKSKLNFEGICNHFKTDRRCTDVMLTYFVALDLITIENDCYVITKKTSEFLLSTSTWNLIPYFSNLLERPIIEKMLDALKTGNPQSWGAKKDELDWAKAMERPDFAAMFTAGMDSRAALMAPAISNKFDFSKYNSLLDIGGASGIYVCSVIDHYPQLTGGILEKSPVDKIAEISIRNKEKQAAVKVIEGDMFQSIPTGFDIHLFSHVLHDWTLEQNQLLINNSFSSLNKGGVIMIHDAHINPEKSGPLSTAEYSILLMFSCYGKCYSITELAPLMESAGFVNIQETHTTGNRSIITGEKK